MNIDNTFLDKINAHFASQNGVDITNVSDLKKSNLRSWIEDLIDDTLSKYQPDLINSLDDICTTMSDGVQSLKYPLLCEWTGNISGTSNDKNEYFNKINSALDYMNDSANKHRFNSKFIDSITSFRDNYDSYIAQLTTAVTAAEMNYLTAEWQAIVDDLNCLIRSAQCNWVSLLKVGLW